MKFALCCIHEILFVKRWKFFRKGKFFTRMKLNISEIGYLVFQGKPSSQALFILEHNSECYELFNMHFMWYENSNNN